MSIIKNLRPDQDIIKRYLGILGTGSASLGNNKRAQAGFFITAHAFIDGYIEQSLFKKEEILIKALEDGGFPAGSGPVGNMRSDQEKSRKEAELIITAANLWQGGDEAAKGELGWALGSYTTTLKTHMERIKTLIIPLLEQTLSLEDEDKLVGGLDVIGFDIDLTKKFTQQIEALEEEIGDWR